MASVALMINGKVIAASHEERFSRIKMDAGFPYKAASFCLTQAGISPKDVDVVALINERFDPDGIASILFKRMAMYEIEDWVKENECYWKPKLIEKQSIGSYFHLMGGDSRIPSHYYDLSGLDMCSGPEEVSVQFNLIRKKTVEKLLEIPEERVIFLTHHRCHHHHAYYSGNIRGQDVAVIHMEGEGGKYNSAVSTVTDKGLNLLSGSNQSDLGRLYQWITLLMGMKPYHHEYKIMGLAPYATENEVAKSFKVFEPVFKLDEENLSVVYNNRPSDLYFHFKDQFTGHRFDGVAGALQLLVETWITKWVEMIVNKTGCRKICYGGGVAMNVKANMLLSQLNCVDNLFVPISPGDETNVFGAGYWMTEKHFLEKGKNPDEIPPMANIYLGPEFDHSDVLNAIRDTGINDMDFLITENIGNKKVAELLANGMIIGCSQGRSEFGQRALGNRSILADPSLPGVVDKINHQIKYRDFWMPFAPTIIDEDKDVYLDNPKNLVSDYMTMCFPVKSNYHEKLKGVLHQGDMTARPQILKRESNPGYYDLISEFKKIKGIGCLLNTSFNLHGEPIVESPVDALRTFLNSELDAVWIEDILVSRKKLSLVRQETDQH